MRTEYCRRLFHNRPGPTVTRTGQACGLDWSWFGHNWAGVNHIRTERLAIRPSGVAYALSVLLSLYHFFFPIFVYSWVRFDIDIISLLIVGFIFILLFLAWQRFLERLRASLGLDLHPDPSIQNTHGFIPEPSKLSSDAEAHLKSLRSKWWAAPPLMKLSMWKRANGRFAAMQFIACLNWCSFVCWSYWVQLYYQNYMGLTPIDSMGR